VHDDFDQLTRLPVIPNTLSNPSALVCSQRG